MLLAKSENQTLPSAYCHDRITAMESNDYLLDHSTLNWPELLAAWDWLLDADMTVQPWLMNRFGDLFFVDEVGVVNWLNVSDGELSEVAETTEEFTKMLEDEEVLEDFFMLELVDEATEAQLTLQPGQCYGFKSLPVIGGEYEAANMYVGSVQDYWDFCSHVHAQIYGLPDGAEIDIEIPER